MKKMLIISILTALTTVLFIQDACAGTGTSAMSFLKIGAGAREEGMGGAQVAVANGANASYWNPAGLVSVKNLEVSLMHLAYFQDINYEYVAVGIPLDDKSAIGINVTYLNYGLLEMTGETSTGDYSGAISGTFGAYDIGGTVSYGLKLTDAISVGLGVKIVSQGIDTDSVLGYGFDGGVICKLPVDNVSLGLMAENIGPNVKDDTMPMNIKVGVGDSLSILKEKDLLAAVDVNYPLDEKKLKLNMGAEYWYADMIGIRGGYKIGYELDTYSVGIGFKTMINSIRCEIDYAFTPVKDLGNTHRISLSLGMVPGK